MGFYEFALGIGVILTLAIVWIMLAYPHEVIGNIFKNMTQTPMYGQEVDVDDVNEEHDLNIKIFYYSFAFIVVLILVWIVKTSVENQRNGVYG